MHIIRRLRTYWHIFCCIYCDINFLILNYHIMMYLRILFRIPPPHRTKFRTCPLTILLFLILFGGTLSLHAQNQGGDLSCVTDVTYKTEETHMTLLPSDVQFDDIPAYDIPEIRFTQKTKSHHEFVDETGEVNHEIVLTGSVNCHEDWESLSSVWVTDESGMKSYYVNKSTGALTLANFFPYYPETEASYQFVKSNVQQSGILYSLMFPHDIELSLTTMGIAYNQILPGVFMVSDSNQFMVIDQNVPPQISHYTYSGNSRPTPGNPPDPNDPNVESYQISNYNIVQCDEFLLSSIISVSKDTLSNGLCSKEVGASSFSEYNFNCCSGGRGGNGGGANGNFVSSTLNNIDKNGSLAVYPNPLNTERLNVILPPFMKGMDLLVSLHSLDGQTLNTYEVNNAPGEISLEIREVLLAQGMYLLQVVGEDHVLTKKFFYIK